MKIIVLGAGMMGRAIAYDLCKHSIFKEITIVDKDIKTLKSAEEFLRDREINFDILDIKDIDDVKKCFQEHDVAISAIPHYFNYNLTKMAIETKTHFLDLGGNNKIVEQQRSLYEEARENMVAVIPDCGLAPGLTSVIVRDIVEQMDSIDCVKIRVGGLPINPKPPFNYQIVFSPNGLINEYVEDAIVLDHGKIILKKSMTEIEIVSFPEPFGELEAFLTSGGCSTLPHTYRDKIGYLDYKTIRYPGHCEQFKPLLDLGFASEEPVEVGGQKIVPRELLNKLLLKLLPINEKDVVLIKIFSRGLKDDKQVDVMYTVVDYYDEENDITAMMRTTGFPVSIIAQMVQQGIIKEHGVFCSEEIVPCRPFFEELKKRNIIINRKIG